MLSSTLTNLLDLVLARSITTAATLLDVQMLMTRETRAKLAAGGGANAKKPTHAVIRVRLPDGLVLQGEFNGGEPVSVVTRSLCQSVPRASRSLSNGALKLLFAMLQPLHLQASRVFQWVSDSLRDPSRIYELITPARRPLVTSAGSVKQADLLPSAMLNFRQDMCSCETMLKRLPRQQYAATLAHAGGAQQEYGTMQADVDPADGVLTTSAAPHTYLFKCLRRAQVAGSWRAGCRAASAAG